MTPSVQSPSPDSLRAVLEQVYRAPAYDWQLPPPNPLRVVWEFWYALLDWFSRLEQEHPVTYWVLLVLMAGLALAILLHFGYVIVQALRPRLERHVAGPAPVTAPRAAAWYLERAERLEGEGRYELALAHRFTALLLELDRRKAVAFHSSKTPAEYVAEAQLAGELRGIFGELVRTLYAHLFGGAPCTADDVRRFREHAALLLAHGT